MIDSIIDLAHDAMSSPWAYAVIFALAAIDGFFPAVPSESVVITAGVFAASGEPNLALIILVAAAGAFVGDHISYYIGRFAGSRVTDRLGPGTARKAAFEWARSTLAERGGMILIIARYIPGGRTAVTLTMGATRYPRRSFALFDGIAGVSWAVYSTMVGYLGGRAFEDEPIKGLLLGFGIAVTVAVLVEVVRHRRRSRRSTPSGDGATDDDTGEPEESGERGERGGTGLVDAAHREPDPPAELAGQPTAGT